MPIKKFSYPLPLKLDRYIIAEVVLSFTGAICLIIFLLLMFQTLRMAEFLVIHGVSGKILAKIAGFMTISFLPTAMPLAFLMSLLFSFSRLSGDCEIIAIKASGISLVRLSIPLFMLAGVVSSFSLTLNNTWVPWSITAYKATEEKIRTTQVTSALKEGAFNSSFFDLLIFADKVDSERNHLQKVFIFDEREPKNPMTYISREADIIPLKSKTEMGSAIVLKLIDGSMHHSNLKYHTYEKMDFKTYQLYLKIKEGSEAIYSKPQMIPQDQLIDLIKNSPINSGANNEYRGEYWRRHSLALAPFIFVLVGVGFGTFRSRGARSSTFLIALLIALFYWTLQILGSSWIAKNTLNPLLAMQLPNITLFLMGIWSFKRASW